MKSTPSGFLVCQSSPDNSLIVYDKDLNQKFKFDGKETQNASYREPHFSYEVNKIIWFNSSSQLCTVDLTNLSYVPSKRLLEGDLAKSSEPLFAIADFARGVYLVIYLIEGEQVMIFVDGDKEPELIIASDVLKEINNINSMDLDKNKKFGVFGGFKKCSKNGALELFKLGGEDPVETINSIDLDCQNVGITRFVEDKEGMLLVGAYSAMFICKISYLTSMISVIEKIDIANAGNLQNYN